MGPAGRGGGGGATAAGQGGHGAIRLPLVFEGSNLATRKNCFRPGFVFLQIKKNRFEELESKIRNKYQGKINGFFGFRDKADSKKVE